LLIELHGVESQKIWYRPGEEAGEEIASFLIGKMKTKRARMAKFLISEPQSAGWGKVTFCGNGFGGIEGMIRIENSSLLSNDSTGDACQLYKGYIAGFLKRTYGTGGVECTDGRA
jgi:predicted hydrocarbon binding protein